MYFKSFYLRAQSYGLFILSIISFIIKIQKRSFVKNLYCTQIPGVVEVRGVLGVPGTSISVSCASSCQEMVLPRIAFFRTSVEPFTAGTAILYSINHKIARAKRD